jgi:hypothetical protein
MKREKKPRKTPRITITDFDGRRSEIRLEEGDTAQIDFPIEVSMNGQTMKSQAAVYAEWV